MMNLRRVASYAAVFGAGALAVAGFTTFTGGSDHTSPTVAASDAATPPATSAESSDAASSATEPAVLDSSRDEAMSGVTHIGELTRNTMVTVTGTVQAVTDEDEFTLVDATGSVPVWTAGTFFTVEPGETVTVTGFIDDDFILEVYAQQIVKADGSIIDISRSDRSY